jgi:hypothetical protein
MYTAPLLLTGQLSPVAIFFTSHFPDGGSNQTTTIASRKPGKGEVS